jgi:hypothetical protein
MNEDQIATVSDAHARITQALTLLMQAARRKIELIVLPTTKAIVALKKNPKEANAILHVTC